MDSMEQNYFSNFKIKENCDFIINGVTLEES